MIRERMTDYAAVLNDVVSVSVRAKATLVIR